MKKVSLMFFLLLTGIVMLAKESDPLKVKEYMLENGLTVWINEDPSQPKVYGAVVVRAGAKESPNTGIAHYFEHIMFKGTDKIGTLNYEAEKVYLDQISVKYDELAQITDEVRRTEIQKEINELSIRASEYVIPNEFDRLISKYGGSKLNAFTSFDLTAYHNEFSPQYFRHWAEINSERVMNPVFRLFQSELETVYEEKNMYADQLGSLALDNLLKRAFAPHPYMYPILGSTENLKNPKLSEMQKFFEDYYVAGNMGLILSGDIDAEEVLPIIRETFGRIREGKAPENTFEEPAYFKGREEFVINFPIPMVKAAGYIWKGVPLNDEDEMLLTIVTRLLNNSNSTGYLDQLMLNQKVMMSAAFNFSLNDAGGLVTMVIPKLMFQSTKKALELLEKEIKRIKSGDFSSEEVEYIKNELKMESQRTLENLNSRAGKMLNVFSQGLGWDEYLELIGRIEDYTKDDVVKVANRYFTDDYLAVSKKTGNYPKDKLAKPGFEPILPSNREATSEYAKSLEKIPLMDANPKFIDLKNDVNKILITPLITLYTKENPINDIFKLKISYKKGTIESRLAAPLSHYLEYLGTTNYSNNEFKRELQKLGSNIYYAAYSESFDVEVSGLDKNFDKTMFLLKDFFDNVVPDKKKMKQIVEMRQLEVSGFSESPDEMASALFEKVRFGDKSSYLNRLSIDELKKLDPQLLLNEFAELRKVECDIHYSGNLKETEVLEQVKKTIDPVSVTMASNKEAYRELTRYTQPMLYFVNAPKAKQSIIYIYAKGEVNEGDDSRLSGNLFTSYFGGSMSSITFQEIREFRSLAYRARVRYAVHDHRDRPGMLYGNLSTQTDKTIEAIALVDSLIKNMPVRAERVEFARQDLINEANGAYPTFRNMSSKVAELERLGEAVDPNRILVEKLPAMDIDDIELFYERNVKGRPLVYIVVGDEKNMDMTELAKYGNFVKLKVTDLYR